MAKAKTEKPRKLKQQHLPTMEPPSIPAIDRLADSYQEVRDERMRLNEEEVKKRDLLQAAMKQHGLRSYEFDGKVVELVSDEKVKVRRKVQENGDGE